MSGTIEILQEYNQLHVLELPKSKNRIEALKNIDLVNLLRTFKQVAGTSVEICGHTSDVIDVLPVVNREEIERHKDIYYYLGISQLKAQKLAVVILSGGQGSRLGYDHAKGMYNVGITRYVSIFELLVNNLKRVVKETGVYIPLYIMTSTNNHKEIQEFFFEHNYFGYSDQYIEFFMQNEYPALDSEGNIYLRPNYDLLMLPSGNGDWFAMLEQSGILDKPQYQCIEWFNVVSVDNPLQNMADPIFLGATISLGCDVGAKVIKKASPEEKIGVICKINNRPRIIEYYELPTTLRFEKDEHGEYKFQYGVTLNYLFKKSALISCQNCELPFHYVDKTVRLTPDTNILVKKAEKLILDMISNHDKVCAYEISREKEFAPIKNRTGPDSVDTARLLLTSNGVVL